MSKSRVVDRDMGWKSILKAATSMVRGATVKVGILDGERGAKHHEGSPLTIAEVAVINEYGTEDGVIPSRPAHRMTFDRRREEIQGEAFKGLVGIVLDRKYTVAQILNAMGMRHAAEIKKTITAGEGVPPPNAPSMIRRKEHKGEWNKGGKAQAAGATVRTLVDSGVTVNALSWSVEIGEEKGESQYLSGSAKGGGE